jgi:hypothetical protein
MEIADFFEEILPQVLDNFSPDNPSNNKRKISKKISHQVRGNNDGANKDE